MSRLTFASAAIDFGTTYSSWAFSLKSQFEKDPTNVKCRSWVTHGNKVSEKAPTSILLKPDESFDSFGYEAERAFSTGEDLNSWFFFRHFKMQLYKRHIDRHMQLEDVSGKKLSALTIFSLSIKYLKNDLLKTFGIGGSSNANEACNKEISTSAGTDDQSNEEVKVSDTEAESRRKFQEKDILWVITVPAIWGEAAKQFMREAANMAGIADEHIVIALEPETASIYCRCLHSSEIKGSFSGLEEGAKYMILDAGGGTVDITVHEVGELGRLKEISQASGGNWGGMRVNEAYEHFLENLFGKSVFAEFKQKETEDYLEFFSTFEVKKRLPEKEFGKTVQVKIPSSLQRVVEESSKMPLKEFMETSSYKLVLKGDKLKIPFDTFKSFFDASVREIVKKVSKILKQRSVSGCKKILMVGGYSNSLFLQNALESEFPEHEIVVPLESELCVMKGAVIFGHDPTFIAERKLKYTYGTTFVHLKSDSCTHKPGETRDIFGKEHCIDLFSIHARAGQIVKIGEEQEEQFYQPLHPLATEVEVQLYSSTEEHPTFITDDSCEKIGKLKIPVTPTLVALFSGGRLCPAFGVTFMFGGTEIKVKAEDKSTGKGAEVTLDYLDE